MSKITAIEIENFQSIKDLVRIDIAPLTLLYGPNSAGKSAVFDALDLIECLWDPIQFDNRKAVEMVTRWARREQQKYLPLKIAVEYLLELGEETYSTNIWREEENWICTKPRTENPSFFISEDTHEDNPDEYAKFEKTTIRLELEIVMACSGDKKVEPAFNYVKIFSGECLVLHYGYNDSLLALSEEEISKWTLREYGRESLISNKTPFFNWAIAGHHTKNKGQVNIDENYTCNLNIPNLDLRAVTRVMFHSPGEQDAYESLFIALFSDLNFYFGTLLGKIFRKSSPLVKADRRVPTPNESLFVVDINIGGWWDTTDPYSSSSPARLLKDKFQSTDPHYSLIAHSAHTSLLLKTAYHDFWGNSHAAKYIEEIRGESKKIDLINEHLEKHLFKEKLYKIECESTLMVPIDLKEDDPWGYYSLAQPAAVRLLLRDGENRKLDLQDVGSGIPFVLPVLYAAVSGTLARTQQPELHLHPALQSELADVFLSEVIKNKNKTFIIETHSEHLLLRLLRRIRDKEKLIPSSVELPLSPEEISIYYFDPQVEGSTFVIKQAVTPLGDFYNDWPRGFFAERDGDLFNV